MLGVTASIVWTRRLGTGIGEARAEAFTADGRMVGAAEARCVLMLRAGCEGREGCERQACDGADRCSVACLPPGRGFV